VTCAACVAAVEKALERVKGVNSVMVSLATEKAYVSLSA
jgi:copper chaperone CopZ